MTQPFVVRQIYRWSPLVFLLLVVALAGMRLGSDNAQAEVRKNAPRPAFQSGSERSEQILREMSQTLKSIDARLARLEKMATMPQP